MSRSRLLPAVLALVVAACAPTPGNKKAIVAAIPLVEDKGWRKLVTKEDERRITDIPATWRRLLSGLPARYQTAVSKEKGLLSPDAGRDHPSPPPGSYRCRLVKFTAPLTSEGRRADAPVKSFPDFFCYIRGEQDNELSFTKQTGTELPRGWLHQDGNRRLILVGARQREAGGTSLAYGMETDRDVVGVVERIGPFRWRLVLPWREARSGLDIYELTPVPMAQQAEEPPPLEETRQRSSALADPSGAETALQKP